VMYGASYSTPANAGIETFFFEKPKDSPGAIAQIKAEMTTVTPAPDAGTVTSAPEAQSGGFAKLVKFLIYGILALALVMVAVKHPYIGRRLLIMIPTMLIISVVTFAIIQMPPGDFVQTRIMELKLTGDEQAIEEVQRLTEVFYLDESLPQQYMRWMGFKWFVSFDEADKGLLQGNMGRSMETQKSVNDIVGDRVLLTVLVSLGTILFTWAIALPIGIYSAVRQYSWGDYALTFMGFIGMCVPNFLLAIILMYWSSKYLGINVTGLFSPEYAAAPEWTWGKIMDLLKHVWVPIIVIALAGTAGMIRVMRGNLLDELRKPYVTTAMAKGVRPFRLLMKYPVRLALNPFISGIGGIFPQLISGGAIVAIVLSLPMVGPVMLQGLMTQDVYLAGSMLMVLSLLGIFGTLVSDLLLLWLDPRIRMEGGSR
jgi:ABC-type dipeptide/oligopeptide/nickel transport system permease component